MLKSNVNKSNIPPLIPASTEFNTNFSQFLRTTEVVVENTLTDGVAILTNETLTNLTNGLDPQDAVNKSYIQGTSIPGGLVNNIQFNDSGEFAGTNAFTWSSPTLTVSGKIEDSTGAFLSGGFASNLLVPVLPQDIATKSYVDAFSGSTTTTDIALDTDTTYTWDQMLNGAIRRDTLTTDIFNVTVNDTTASAEEIITNGGLGLGSIFSFILSNDIIDVSNITQTVADQFKINIIPGDGITFDIPSNPVLNRNYIMFCKGVVTDIGSGTEAIKFIVESLACPILIPAVFFTDPNITIGSTFNAPYVYSSQEGFPLKIQKNLLFPTDDTINTAVNYTYTVSDIKNSIMVRAPTAASADDLFNPSPNFLIGSTSFVIQNTSPTFSITLTANSSWNSYIPGGGLAPVVIGPEHSAYLAIEQDEGASSDKMNVYVLGVFKYSNV